MADPGSTHGEPASERPAALGLVDDAWSPRPDEPLRGAWFEGLLEGAKGDPADFAAIVARIEALGLGAAKLDLDARRARLLLAEERVDAQRLTDTARRDLLSRLQDFLDATIEPRQAESTLRCTEVFATRTRETVFKPIAGEVQCVARVRPKSLQDDARIPSILAPTTLAGLSLGTVGVLLAVVLVAFGGLAWQSGWVDRALAAEAESITLDAGPFEGLLVPTLDKHWGDYVVRLKRGPKFPETIEAVKTLEAETTNLAQRACIRAVADGAKIWAILRDSSGEALGSREVDLRPLVGQSDAVAEAKLPGRFGATKLVLSLDSGPKAGSH